MVLSLDAILFKGQCDEIFYFRFLFMNHPPPGPDNAREKKSPDTVPLTVNFRCRAKIPTKLNKFG